MEKQDGSQLELFSETKDSLERSAARAQRKTFALSIWGYEKTVLIAIALLVTGIVFFSLGVEKGKRLSVTNSATEALRDSNGSANLVSIKPEENKNIEKPILIKKAESLNAAPILGQGGPYTIQVASFKGKVNAREEAELLRKRGYKASFINSGSYVILCVGNFPNKETAQPLLSELRKYYKDCRIRRL